VDELELLHKILTKVETLSNTMSDMNRRLFTVESGLEFIRKTFETNGKSISNIQDTLTVHAQEISDLGFEIRGTPLPENVAAKFVKRRKD